MDASIAATINVRSVPGAHWEYVSAEALGWSSDLLAKAKAYSQHIGSSAVVIVKGGRVVAEWGDTARKSEIASVRKSLLSALIGMAVEEGRIRLTDTLAALGINDKGPSLTPEEREATVADLLTSRSGVYHAVDLEPEVLAAKRPPRGSHPHGTHWYYSNWDFNALGTIYLQATGTGIFAAFTSRIADPIEMEDFVVSDGQYGTSNKSIHRHYGFRMSARDLARFGLLYLRGGRWGDRQVVPARWVGESTRPHAQVHWPLFAGTGYGYMWWTGFANDFVPFVSLPRGTFYAHGFGAQYVFVIPEHDIVIVHTVDMEQDNWPWIDDGKISRLIWLVLTAAGAKDIGPDTSLAAAAAHRCEGDALRDALAGTTLRFAERATDGPYFLQLAADGAASLTKGQARQLAFTGKWWVEGDKLCRGWDHFSPRYDCWSVAIDGTTVSLYQDADTMYFQAVLARE